MLRRIWYTFYVNVVPRMLAPWKFRWAQGILGAEPYWAVHGVWSASRCILDGCYRRLDLAAGSFSMPGS